MRQQTTRRVVVVLAKMHVALRGGFESHIGIKRPGFVHCEVPRASAGANIARTPEVNCVGRVA
jgi:hypothetical protein